MNPEHACNPPHQILGLTIRSRTRIYVSYIIPNVFESLVYIIQIVADCAVSYQHFKSLQYDFAWATLSLILIPPAVTCALILSSKSQWIKPKQNGTVKQFVFKQLLQMIFFPVFVIYRSAKLVFWSIDALFHDDDDKQRMECLEKAEECSTCELYRLVQAYGQSAPQIILQLYHMLTQDLFRNFQTSEQMNNLIFKLILRTQDTDERLLQKYQMRTTKIFHTSRSSTFCEQAISLVFSAIDLASITTIYQRFESQKQVGRHYPWSTEAQKQESYMKLKKNICYQAECLRMKRESERTLNKFSESDKIMENFKAKICGQVTTDTIPNLADSYESLIQVSQPISHSVQVHASDELENEAGGDEQIALMLNHLTDDDKMKTKTVLPCTSQKSTDSPEEFDMAPNTPPPWPPVNHEHSNFNNGPQLRKQTSFQTDTETNKRRSKAFSQLETFKDMLLINAQLYIKENMPRPPKILTNHIEISDHEPTTRPQSPKSPKDEVDFFLPGRPAKVVNGIQQEDFAAKTVAFFGWIAFVAMRLLSLSAFCVFYPKAFFILSAVHYFLMLAALHLETRFKGALNKIVFYFLLAYVYIYVLLEFRVKFKHVRIWLVGYILISLSENLTMTMIWYAREDFESWWFDFIFEGIIYSGILFMATIIVYYLILKPKDVIFLVDNSSENQNKQQQQTNATTATTATDV